MPFRGDRRTGADTDDLRRRAFELGIEVGRTNHLETVGWVSSEIRSLKQEAERASVLEEVQREYQRGKKIGIARRARLTSGLPGGLAKKAVGPSRTIRRSSDAAGASHLPVSAGFVERISAVEGLESTIRVMKFAASEPNVKKDLNGSFAGIMDIQERLLDLEPGDSPMATFERCLRLLVEVGWIDRFDLTSFDEMRAVVVIRSTTAIANASGHSAEPLCHPVCNLLETAGRKAFNKSVMVVEDECIAQGRTSCVFEVTPRKVLGVP
jgi:hypothetical protein